MVALAAAVKEDLGLGKPVALGFECPLFVPISEDPVGLTKARVGEGARAWCAGAGAGALATGLTQTVWVLDQIGREVGHARSATVNWKEFVSGDADLFLWEAFVSGTAKGPSHMEDAELGARAFVAALPDPETSSAIHVDKVHSLIGAAMLRTGWSADLRVLSTPCLVIRVQSQL
jgi:hypothetical protein